MRWLQYILFLSIVVGLAPPVGLYLARVCERLRTFLDPFMTARVYTASFLLFGAGCAIPAFPCIDFSTFASRWSSRFLPANANNTRSRRKYGGELHDDNNMASVCRREYAPLPRSGTRPGLAKFPGGRSGACSRLRFHPGDREGTIVDARQFLGRSDSFPALGDSAVDARRKSRVGLARCSAEHGTVHHCSHT